ncbi:hypothetical protein PSCICO_03920 [Pseudomonas cichorii]|uniref:hypothetical protein n=1 Tax=Pseudomonas cichorii TaxID=36746 RepID=UPI00191043A3|nr:hypothetical protein [Pseudomonas cichorii]GFM84993.1 hypothetical protein PSCICO_03920 [Pseudomonas cichorii]
MSKAQKEAAAKYRAAQIQVQALINPDTESELAESWAYLRRQFGGSGKKAISWAISNAKNSMDLFYIWKDGEENAALTVWAVNMNTALDEAAYRHGYVDYADMAQEMAWSGGEGLNIKKAEM